MDTRRLERLVIIILALLDLCLLCVVAADRIQMRRDRSEREVLVAAMLEENGIRAEALKLPETPPLLRLLRDAAAEQKLLQALVGDTTGEDLGGGIRFFRGKRGQAMLRGTGEIELLFAGSVGGADPMRTAERMFARGGLALGETDRAAGDDFTELRCCLRDGIPIVNAVLEFDISGGELSLISGLMPFQKEQKRSAEGIMDAATALSRFLELVRREGIVCSRLDGIFPVYLLSVPVAGECTLTPLWHIRTDTGSFYLNAVTGKLESVG